MQNSKTITIEEDIDGVTAVTVEQTAVIPEHPHEESLVRIFRGMETHLSFFFYSP